jgi:hypothetical protein
MRDWCRLRLVGCSCQAQAVTQRIVCLFAAVLESGESWRLFTSMLLHGGLTHLALDTFFLGTMGPGGLSCCLLFNPWLQA